MAKNLNSISQEMSDSEDDRPLAVRRKRRMSTGLADPSAVVPVPTNEEGRGLALPRAKTPTKGKKRVRFSDPGLEASGAGSSTGLTPHLSRTSFSRYDREGSPTRAAGSRLKRLSLPAHLSTSLPTPLLSPSPETVSGEVQFKPLRQILDPRVKRRLRRNGLSEELNNIEADQKENAKYKHEIQDLKNQLASVQNSNDEEHSEKMTTGVTCVKEVQGTEKKNEETNKDTQTHRVTPDSIDGSLEQRQEISSGIDIYVDNDDADSLAPTLYQDEDDRDTNPIEAPTNVNDAATQAAVSSPNFSEVLREARLSLEYLFPGEIPLGLTSEDPKPLLDSMLEQLRDLKAQVILAEDSLSTVRVQESNLRNQFNAVLAQLERARKCNEPLYMKKLSETARADALDAKVHELENTIKSDADKAEEMRRVNEEKDLSNQRLKDALETYRVEVRNLESLITEMEEKHSTRIANLQSDMDEAVADLECHVAAETHGRREAERDVVHRDEKIKQLLSQERELKEALNEKQLIIRETERIFGEERLGREREVGGLNVQIGQLTTELSESNAKVLGAQEKQDLLMRKLIEERDAGLRAVELVQAELARCEEKAEDVKTTYVSDVQRRGNEVNQHKGLLTPVLATRFHDVEGHVEMGRGKGRSKKRPDSGIVILEEDEDTIMADDP